jgi:hypothetical protein
MDHGPISILKFGRVAAALSLGPMALSLILVVPADSLNNSIGVGGSMHAKNGATPEWILELQTRNGQLPARVENDETSYWI